MSGFDEVIQQFRWEEERISAELRCHMCEAHATRARVARERCASFRTAAYILAIGRVGRATALRAGCERWDPGTWSA